MLNMPGMIQPERELTWNLDGKLIIARVKSLFSGQWHTMETHDVTNAVTQAQWNAWQAGEHIQTAMPQLSAEEREFLMSGATPEEWAEMAKEFDDD